VEIRVPSDLPTIRMDTQRIREVLMHLLDNAGKYSGTGTPIKVTAEVKSDRLVISVADRGIGIDSLEQTLIFDKFYRGGRQRYTAPGAGMGLPIAKAIVGAHGGTIGVVSQLGQGSVFSISLPIYGNLTAPRQMRSGTVGFADRKDDRIADEQDSRR
jgi:two-component system, OmpR family, sensor histidine kinase KdpD